MANLNASHAPASSSAAPVGRLMKMEEVVQETSLSRTTIFRRVRDGQFPKSIPLGGKRVAWSATAVEQWKRDRASSSI